MRETYIDVAKCISMLLIIRIHTECTYETDIPYPIIAVPFFFFVSGFFDKSEKPWRLWIKKYAYSLLFPAFIWSLITFLFVSLLTVIKNCNFEDVKLPISIYAPFIGNGVTWFLVALFWVKVFVGVIERIFPTRLKWRNVIVYVSVVLGCWGLAGINMPLLLDEGLAALPFYFLGKIIYPSIKKLCACNLMVIICFIVSFVMLWSSFPSAVISFSAVYYNKLFYPLFCFIIIVSFLPFLKLSLILKDSHLLSEYGQHTLGVLVLHPLFLHFFAVIFKRIFEHGSFEWYFAFCIAFVVTIFICFRLSKYLSEKYPLLLGK